MYMYTHIYTHIYIYIYIYIYVLHCTYIIGGRGPAARRPLASAVAAAPRRPKRNKE